MGQRFLGSRNADTVEHYISVLRTLTKDSQVIAGAFGVMAKDIANVSSQALSPHKLLTSIVSCAYCGPIAHQLHVPASMLCCASLQGTAHVFTCVSSFLLRCSSQRLSVSLHKGRLYVINLSLPLYEVCATADLQM